MATLDDVALLAAELPGVTEGERHGNRTWFVGGKAFRRPDPAAEGLRPGAARRHHRRLACASPALARRLER